MLLVTRVDATPQAPEQIAQRMPYPSARDGGPALQTPEGRLEGHKWGTERHPVEMPARPQRRRNVMLNESQPPLLTYEDFLAYVAPREEDYEFVDGQAVALASPSKPHGRLALAVGATLRAYLAGRPCDVYLHNDVWTGRNARRPDIAVTCDKNDLENDDDVLRAPTLVVEIRSKNRGKDLTRKVAEYQSVSSILDYVVIDSRKRWVRHYYRSSVEKLFVFDHDYIGGRIDLTSIDYTLDIEALYDEARISIKSTNDMLGGRKEESSQRS